MIKFHFICLFFFFILLPFSLQAQDTTELKKWADNFSEAVMDEETDYLKTVLHKPTFADKIIIKSAAIQGFNDGFTDGLNEDFLLRKLILRHLTTGFGTYSLIKTYFDGQDAHALFRLHDGDAFDYHDLLLKKFNGEYRIIDLYSYNTGEYASVTFKRLYLTIAKDLLNSAETENLPDINITEMTKVAIIKQALDQGLYRSAEQGMNDLSAETKKEKIVRLIEVIIAGYRGDKRYLKALTKYHRDYPNDPSIYITSIDYLILQKEFKEAHKAIDRLDELVGGDSFLDLLRAKAYYKEADFTSAVERYKSFNASFPLVVAGWEGLLNTYVDMEEYSNAVTALDGMTSSLFFVSRKTLADGLEDDPFYNYFVKSKEFKKWKKRKN